MFIIFTSFTFREQTNKMNENQIVQKALERLSFQTGINGRWTPAHNGLDRELTLYLPREFHAFVEVKRELRQYQLPNIIKMAERYTPFMVVAERIFPKLKDELRERKIGYLDTAGNIFIHNEEAFIWIEGNKPEEPVKPPTNRAFTKKGLEVVFYLLLYPQAINLPYRKLAEATGVALGNIVNIVKGLKEAGFILQLNQRTMLLQHKKNLLHRWIAGYRETLKPALHMGNFQFWKDDGFINWKQLPVKPKETLWGGEAAAEVLTGYLNPGILTLYTTQPRAELITSLKLIPKEKGNVQIYEKFWKDGVEEDPSVNEFTLDKNTPPLLVYADLIITDDPRCVETAEMIYDQYLKNEFD
jgi:hypothetical protein